ncbi:hypothetical protein PRIPAC_88967 [Pristionchus pacificus]|uniref:F-box domain-containing protein n=1 Tax=Pristionchus pacificus TaxID=54126 RepID=A0A2A6CV37_PRIPA|nr:hypothetical protein PRIPAC_88967 [Pristionchus pacificus]|eukprot:PDM82092.1 hypothetical protein PRIPAC_36485 [Pristionchus pacificus]
MFTTIPTDCILEILPYLEENDLFEISCLSHRIFEIVKFPLKKSNHRRKGCLRIVESEYGLSFKLKYKDADINFCYTLNNCPWCGPHKGKRFTFTDEMDHDYEKFLLQERHFVTPRLNVNSKFLACLKKKNGIHGTT